MIDFVNAMIQDIASILTAILSLLPSSPFTWDLSGASSFMGWFDYFVPVSAIVTLISSYVAAVAVWYMYRWVLKLVKFIG